MTDDAAFGHDRPHSCGLFFHIGIYFNWELFLTAFLFLICDNDGGLR